MSSFKTLFVLAAAFSFAVAAPNDSPCWTSTVTETVTDTWATTVTKTVTTTVPGSPESTPPSTSAVAQQCGNGQQLSCCNSVDNFLGLGCTVVSVLDAVPITQTCGSNQAACCNIEQTGIINLGLSCIPINL